jgi:aryl-alcohol dehydrogenase-like predicted oxidoreductase
MSQIQSHGTERDLHKDCEAHKFGFGIALVVLATMKLFAKHALKSVVGNSTTSQSGLGFGCMGITAFYGATMPDADALVLLKGVYDTGCRHFDTAEIYAAGDKYNEAILGEFFQTVPRDSFSVATKYYPKEDSAHVYSYDTVKSCLLASLKRLKLDYVDLYYAHRVFTLEGGKTFAKAAQRLKEEGLIREIGLSEVSGKWLREIYNDGAPIDAVQQEWSLLTRSLESELVPVCKELDVPIVAYRYVL